MGTLEDSIRASQRTESELSTRHPSSRSPLLPYMAALPQSRILLSQMKPDEAKTRYPPVIASAQVHSMKVAFTFEGSASESAASAPVLGSHLLSGLPRNNA